MMWFLSDGLLGFVCGCGSGDDLVFVFYVSGLFAGFFFWCVCVVCVGGGYLGGYFWMANLMCC